MVPRVNRDQQDDPQRGDGLEHGLEGGPKGTHTDALVSKLLRLLRQPS